MNKLILAVAVVSLFLSQPSYALSDCDVCLRFNCTYKGFKEVIAQFQFGAEPVERLEFERPYGSFYLNTYFDRSDESFVYYFDDKSSGYTVKASNSLYDAGSGDLLIEFNGAPIENGEYSCTKK